MSADTHPAVRARSPSWEDRVGLGTLFFAVFGGPLAWFAQLTVNYALDSHPCFPQFSPRSDLLPGWDWVNPAVLAINLAAIAVALTAAVVSLQLWRATSEHHPPLDTEFSAPLSWTNALPCDLRHVDRVRLYGGDPFRSGRLADGAGMPRLSLLAALPLLTLAACDESQQNSMNFGGDSRRGAQLIAYFGCGSCHSIPGVRGARGRVGPPLDNIGERTIVAGLLPNTPDNLMTWLKAPQRVVPGNAMPNMGLNDNDARDVAAYLYTLR